MNNTKLLLYIVAFCLYDAGIIDTDTHRRKNISGRENIKMIAGGLDPLTTSYQICFTFVTFFSLLAIGVFVGLAVYDIWACDDFTKSKKIIYTIAMFLFPEIGVICWVFLLGKIKKLIFRIIAFCTSAFYLVFLTAMFFTSPGNSDLKGGLLDVSMIRCLWSPFTVLGGGISFFVFRSIFSDKTSTKENSKIIS